MGGLPFPANEIGRRLCVSGKATETIEARGKRGCCGPFVAVCPVSSLALVRFEQRPSPRARGTL